MDVRCFGDFVPLDVDLLVQLSSEGFSPSPITKHQLWACAQMRAIETRRTMVRCVHGGETCVIDASGRIVVRSSASTPLFVEVPIMKSWTVYHQLGDTIPWTLVIIGAVCAEWSSWKERRTSVPVDKLATTDEDVRRTGIIATGEFP